MENAAKQNLGKHYVVKILIFLSLIAMWQVRQLGNTFSREHTKQLRVQARHTHEHAAVHNVDGDSGAASSDEETKDTAEENVDTVQSPANDATENDGSDPDSMGDAQPGGLSQSNSEASKATPAKNDETETEVKSNNEEEFNDDQFYVEEEEDNNGINEDDDISKVKDLSKSNSEALNATLVSKTNENEIEVKNSEEEEEDDHSEVEGLSSTISEPSNATLVSKTTETETQVKNSEEEEEENKSEVKKEDDPSEVEGLSSTISEPSNATLVSKTNETETQVKNNEEEEKENNSEVEEEDDPSEVEGLSSTISEPSNTTLVSKTNETEIQVKNNEEDENSQVEDLSPSQFKASEEKISSHSVKTNSTSSSNETEVTNDSKKKEASTTDPIISTNKKSTAKQNTGSKKPQERPMVSAITTDSPDATVKTFTESSEETMENNSSSPHSVGDETEASSEPTPEEKQLALWQAAKERFDATQPWKNQTTFTTVDRGVYQDIVQKAKVSVKSVLEEVYTGCELYIFPASDDGPSEMPRIQYKCLGDENPIFQNDICHTVNMCRVLMVEETWKQGEPAVTSNTAIKKSTLLTMVDSVEQLMSPKTFKGFINKASYAYRSNRSFYIWIGNLDQNELNRREVETLGPSFGFRCTVREITNSKNYYKPIAFLVVFDTLKSSSPGTESIFYLDADAAFTRTAFERIDNDKFNGTNTNTENIAGPMGPESYLGLSPQASLMGTTNPNGSSLINSGVMIFRNTRWSKDFMALWWYGRCGSQDQLSLWLMLYATFSAWTANEVGSKQFAYPGEIFFDYTSMKNKLFMHFRQNAHPLQDSWKATIERRQEAKNENGIKKDDEDDYTYPVPTSTELYNGGGMRKRLFEPLELPHVVVFPPTTTVSYTATIEGTSKDQEGSIVEVNLPVLRADTGDDSFVVHSNKIDSCSDRRCWPYVEK